MLSHSHADLKCCCPMLIIPTLYTQPGPWSRCQWTCCQGPTEGNIRLVVGYHLKETLCCCQVTLLLLSGSDSTCTGHHLMLLLMTALLLMTVSAMLLLMTMFAKASHGARQSESHLQKVDCHHHLSGLPVNERSEQNCPRQGRRQRSPDNRATTRSGHEGPY